jgi:penicillin-insensitive murein endopeptidase
VLHRAVQSTGALAIASLLSLLGCAEVHTGARAPQAPSFAATGDASQAPVILASGELANTDDGAVVPATHTDDGDDEDGDELLEDDHDEEQEHLDLFACLDRGPSSPPDCPQFTVKSPLTGLSDAEIARRVKEDLASIGPISLGPPNGGRLFNGIRMPDGDRWTLTDPGNAYGTQESIDSITKAIDKVFTAYPDSPKVIIGHISAKGGGRLKPHKSHQAGRDVDLSYFYKDKKSWYTVANAQNLDRERSWAFIRAFVEDPNVEMILVDTSIQKLLREHALAKGEDPAFIDRVFQYGSKSNRPIIRHVRGHATHIHVRFFSPNAQASARLASAYLPKPPPPPKRKSGKQRNEDMRADASTGGSSQAKHAHGKKEAADDSYVLHRARSGDTLDALARKYGVSVQEIKQANGLKSNSLKQKKTYRIPKRTASSSSADSSKSRQRK